MKRSSYKNFFLTLVIMTCGMAIHAQKASDRPFATELKKIKEMQEARKKTLQQTQQAADNNQTPAATNPENKTKQQPATKSSTQPMAIPKKPKKQ